jgi:hypothetical protein
MLVCYEWGFVGSYCDLQFVVSIVNFKYYWTGKLNSLKPEINLNDIFKNSSPISQIRGTRYHSWLRHYATSQKVAGLNPIEIIGFFS